MTLSDSKLSFDDALAAAREGHITREIARVLIRAAPGGEYCSLLEAAWELRSQLKGSRVSYSKKVFIPLTNLCRDYCGYCTFRRDPSDPGARTMTPDQVLAIAEAGAAAGCKEALFSLGDRPEALFPEMREALRRFGHRTTLGYLADVCERVLNQTGLLPHVNPGLMARADLENLRRLSPSMGLMLESTSNRLLATGMPHDNAPDKLPVLRLKTIAEAGRLRIPFTSGILIGIGESLDDRVESLFVLRELHERFGHIQEVIVQNFRAKPEIPMRNHPEPMIDEHGRTIAVARLILREMNVQAPPNLSDEHYPQLLDAGLNDWGGISPVTKDFINPEKPWPHIERLASQTAAKGLQLVERLSVYPEFVAKPDFFDQSLIARIADLSNGDGLARVSAQPSPAPRDAGLASRGNA